MDRWYIKTKRRNATNTRIVNKIAQENKQAKATKEEKATMFQNRTVSKP
jgi:hypothetical protein